MFNPAEQYGQVQESSQERLIFFWMSLEGCPWPAVLPCHPRYKWNWGRALSFQGRETWNWVVLERGELLGKWVIAMAITRFPLLQVSFQWVLTTVLTHLPDVPCLDRPPKQGENPKRLAKREERKNEKATTRQLRGP